MLVTREEVRRASHLREMQQAVSDRVLAPALQHCVDTGALPKPERPISIEWDVSYNEIPIQAGMGKDPWRVAVCSFLLCRARRVQMREPLRELLQRWPNPMALACADTDELENVLRPCGLHRSRARQLQRFSSLFTSDGWSDLQELPGVGAYVSDAVGLFCFDREDIECTDEALLWYIANGRCSR